MGSNFKLEFSFRMVFVWTLISVLLVCVSSEVDRYKAMRTWRTVDTKSGPVRGMRKTSLLKEVDYYAFKGIPYAQAPIGKLRFKAPEPIPRWTKLLQAFEHGNTCLRPNVGGMDAFPQSEDCLYLNIYVPANASMKEKIPVLFFIHGGGYSEMNGNDHIYGPDFLMEQNVILVTFNYRIGVLGFLSLDTPEYSGNMGLKDQQMALKWIHNNIGSFFGDNKRITIIGQQTGGSSAHFHVLSSESRKYFKNAMVLSGTSENIWAMSDGNNHVNEAFQMAHVLGQPQNNIDDLIQYLQMVPAQNFTYFVYWGNNYFRTLHFTFAPVVERKDAKMPFMTATPMELYQTSEIDTDVIFYHTSFEMVAFFTNMYPRSYTNVWELNTNFTLYLPFKGFKYPFESAEYQMFAQEVRKFYFGDAVIDEEMSMQYIDLLSDLNFVYPNYRAMRMHAGMSKGKTYFFQFSVDSMLNFLKRAFQNEGSPGANDNDEACYMFRCNVMQPLYDAVLKDRSSQHSMISLQAIDNLTKLIANYAKYGDPTYMGDLIADLNPIQMDNINGLDINNEGLKLISDPKHASNQFWTQLHEHAQRMIDGTK